MRKLPLLCLAVLIVFAGVAAPASADGKEKKKKATIKVINQSKWEIHHLYLSPSSESHWGPDQLEDAILKKGESITLTNIDCDDYDIKVVDEDGDECVIENETLCGDNSYWKVTDKELLSCEGHP